MMQAFLSPPSNANASPTSADHAGTKVRKPYTITKQRERWTNDEHQKFLDALKLHGRAWRLIEEHIGTKTAIQIRSHAQKFFSKLERDVSNGGILSRTGISKDIEIPPPRPKRKPCHPYPRKAGSISSGLHSPGKSPPTIHSSFRPVESLVNMSLKPSLKVAEEIDPKTDFSSCLRLFGKTMIVGCDDGANSDSCCTYQDLGHPDSQIGGKIMKDSIVESIMLEKNEDHKYKMAEATDSDSGQTQVSDVEISMHKSSACQEVGSVTGSRCSCAPWQLPHMVVHEQLGICPSSFQTLWQGPMSDAFAATMATAMLAVASAWQQVQGFSSRHSDPSLVYSPLAVAQKPSTSSPPSSSLIEQQERKEGRWLSNGESSDDAVPQKRHTILSDSNESEIVDAPMPMPDMQNSGSAVNNMDIKDKGTSDSLGNEYGNGSSLFMIKAGALNVSTRYSGAGFLPYEKSKRLKLVHLNENEFWGQPQK